MSLNEKDISPATWWRTGEFFDHEAPVKDPLPGICEMCGATPVRFLIEVLTTNGNGASVAWICPGCASPFDAEDEVDP